jgi:Zn-dependent protease
VTSPSTYSYTYVPPRPTAGRITTSRRELTQIGIAFAVLTLDLTLIYGGGGYLEGGGGFYAFAPAIVATAATAAFTGFLLHELAHKIAAQRRGYWAEFRMAPVWLLFSIFSAFLGFLWAAPGATLVNGMTDVREWGRTALAGPLSNFAFGLAFYAAAVATYFTAIAFTPYLLLLAFINGWFAAFNLIPYGPLDGHKVWSWDRGIWVMSFAVAIGLAAVSYSAETGIITPLLGR